MIPQSCLLIESNKFPVLPGEDQEITNERMYGKALCQYLQTELPLAGINVPSYFNEDWGWWLAVERGAFKMGLCIYSDPTVASVAWMKRSEIRDIQTMKPVLQKVSL